MIVLSRKAPSRVRLRNIDRLIFVWLYRFLPSILNAITVVKDRDRDPVAPARLSGLLALEKSRRCGGRPKIDRDTRSHSTDEQGERTVGSARGSTANC